MKCPQEYRIEGMMIALQVLDKQGAKGLFDFIVRQQLELEDYHGERFPVCHSRWRRK